MITRRLIIHARYGEFEATIDRHLPRGQRPN
jgi:hypothetical protein